MNTAKVLGCAGKATGKYKNWYNLLLIRIGEITECLRKFKMRDKSASPPDGCAFSRKH